MYREELESLICRLGVGNFFILMADICEDRLVYLYERIKYFDNHPIDFEGEFNEQIANELAEEFNCQASEFIEAYQEYHKMKNSIELGKEVVKVLRLIKPDLKAEDWFKKDDTESLVYHRDKYQAYFILDSNISKLGIETIFKRLIEIFNYRFQESEDFYFQMGIIGEWQEYLYIVEQLNYITLFAVKLFRVLAFP